MKRQSESQSSSCLSITVQRFFSFWTDSALRIGNCCWLVLLSVFPALVLIIGIIYRGEYKNWTF